MNPELAVVGSVDDPAAESGGTRSLTPDVVAHFDATIEELRAQVAALRAALQEQKLAGEHKQARMVSLNMALNGAPREEAERYLSQNFGLADAGPLLDDAYGRDAS